MTIFKRFLLRNSKVQKVLSQNLQSWSSLDGLKHNYCNYLREVRLSIPQPTLQELPEKLSQLSILAEKLKIANFYKLLILPPDQILTKKGELVRENDKMVKSLTKMY